MRTTGRSELYEAGMARLRTVLPDADERVAQAIPHADLARYTVESVYGTLHSRPALGPRDRELITVCVLTTLGGCDELLAGHVEQAYAAGLAPEEILETILQCGAYAGVPRAIQASRQAMKVLDRLRDQAKEGR
ncbi:carboxymuconolactone decarboxylase family protein [Streptomyces sp. NPDC054796]